MDFSLQFVDKDWGKLDMTIYGKKILFVLETWNSVLDSMLVWEIQISYWLNSQTNCRASNRAQTSLFSVSFTIYGENFLYVVRGWNLVPNSILDRTFKFDVELIPRRTSKLLLEPKPSYYQHLTIHGQNI